MKPDIGSIEDEEDATAEEKEGLLEEDELSRKAAIFSQCQPLAAIGGDLDSDGEDFTVTSELAHVAEPQREIASVEAEISPVPESTLTSADQVVTAEDASAIFEPQPIGKIK
ncbi:hypothetical protein HDE_12869 [Halotydeus destructor]|nr:hypothetical protein HDE_12869 [Halotydeus destructor]